MVFMMVIMMFGMLLCYVHMIVIKSIYGGLIFGYSVLENILIGNTYMNVMGCFVMAFMYVVIGFIDTRRITYTLKVLLLMLTT